MADLILYNSFPQEYWAIPASKESWQLKYLEFKNTDKWLENKQLCLHVSNNECCCCGEFADIAHYKRYPENYFGTENPMRDLSAMCSVCHTKYHAPSSSFELLKQFGKTKCPTCGAKIVKYRHSLSILLCTGLKKLYTYSGSPVNIKELGLGRSAWQNFSDLRYWGLIGKPVSTDIESGVWEITKKGVDFVEGRVKVTKSIWSYRGEVWDDGEPDQDTLVYIDQVTAKHKERKQYIEEARPLNKPIM